MSRVACFVVFVILPLGVACTGSSSRCVPGMAIDCVCAAGVHGVQVCQGDGTFTACECGTVDAGRLADSGSATDSGSAVDASTNDASTNDASTNDAWTDPCAGHVYYAGRYDGAGPVWASLPAASGMTSLAAGDAQCAALGVGADHVCDYTEVAAADAAGEAAFRAIPMGTTAWVQRTTTVSLIGTTPNPAGTPSAPGPGGNCNDWTYATNHIGDGEYATFDTTGHVTFHLDNDTIYDGANPGVHTITGDLECGGVTRSILCCFSACM